MRISAAAPTPCMTNTKKKNMNLFYACFFFFFLKNKWLWHLIKLSDSINFLLFLCYMRTRISSLAIIVLQIGCSYVNSLLWNETSTTFSVLWFNLFSRKKNYYEYDARLSYSSLNRCKIHFQIISKNIHFKMDELCVASNISKI